ncbi:MAG: ABC transporter permease [Christensenellales bacterium]|jgi:ABC-type uncharacterized transport system permease subunit
MEASAWVDFLSATIRTSTPIALATLACTFSERAGVINIGIEGTMIASAFAGAVGTYFSGNAWVGMLMGMLTGALLASIIAVLSIYCNGDQVVIGIGINLLGPGLSYLIMYTLWGSRGTSPWLQGFSVIDIPLIKDIPYLSKIISGYNPTVYICLALVIIMHYVLYHTKYGLRIRAVGENPNVVATAGLDVYGLRTGAVIIGGLLAGIAGVSLSLGSLNVFTNGMTANRGFLAYAANRFGQWTPIGSYLASLLFGSMEALRIRLQGLEIAPQFLQMLPYVTALIALTVRGHKLRAPAADGLPYPHPISIARATRNKSKFMRLSRKKGMQSIGENENDN